MEKANVVKLKIGKTYVHKVMGNPTTGFDWDFKVEPKGIIEIEKTIEYPKSESPTVGEPSTYSFLIKGIKNGK